MCQVLSRYVWLGYVISVWLRLVHVISDKFR